MTCIVGVKSGDEVYIGGDSAGVAGLSVSTRADEKVFYNGRYLIGIAGSFRMGNLLRYSLKAPPPPKHEDTTAFMVNEFMDIVRDTFKRGGYMNSYNAQEVGGVFLVGVAGQLYRIDSDFQVGIPADNYESIGCGEEIAKGNLHVTANAGPPEARVQAALEAAAYHSAGVQGPFTILKAKQ